MKLYQVPAPSSLADEQILNEAPDIAAKQLHGEGAEIGKLIHTVPDIKLKLVFNTDFKRSRSEKLEPRKVSKQAGGKTDMKVTAMQSKEEVQQIYGTVREHPGDLLVKTGELFYEESNVTKVANSATDRKVKQVLVFVSFSNIYTVFAGS